MERFAYQPPPEIPRRPFTVLVYGRFYRKKKGVQLVVRACESLYRQGYNIRLILFDAPVDEKARAQVKSFTANVPFQFYVDHPVEDLAAIYHQADVFVSAERGGGWSNTAAEAMACGVPVIATTSGTMDFLIDGVTGLRVYRFSWSIRHAIRKLYTNDRLRESLAEQGYEKIKAFTWAHVAASLERFARKALMQQDTIKIEK